NGPGSRRRLQSSSSRARRSSRARVAVEATATRLTATRRAFSMTCSRAGSRSSGPRPSTASSSVIGRTPGSSASTSRQREHAAPSCALAEADVPRIASATRVEQGFSSLPEALRRWGRQRSTERALSQGDEELSYGDLVVLVEEAAQRLAGAGARPRDRIALLGSNTVEWVVVFLAGLRLGAIVVPLNIRLGPMELRRQLDVCEPRLLLTAAALLQLVEQVGSAPGGSL